MGCAIKSLTFLLLFSAAPRAFAQPPGLQYTLRVDCSDSSGYTITIHVDHAPHRFHLAMATHHEYDDRYWRFVTGFSVPAPASFTHEDSAVWTITSPGKDAIVSYRIRLPPPPPFHFSHRPFLTRHGGLVGDLHSFMYLVEYPQATCRLTLQLPVGWESATALDTASYTAPQLLDAPILIGRLHKWRFSVDNTLHEVAYLPPEPAIDFDTVALITNIQKIVRAVKDIFGGFPYQHYSFLLEGASGGALEHGSSVTIGIQPTDLASPKPDLYGQIAHEFFHTWNLMHIRPAPYTDLNYGTQQQSPGLWFSEGVTMLYADLINRRTGLPVEDSTRIAHLTSLITRYYRDTGNTIIQPAKVSLAGNLQPGPLGDFSASTHLQGELLGTCVDMLIRDATDGRRSFDDAMRDLYQRFSDKQPIRDNDVESAVTRACGCADAHAFFADYLAKGRPIDFAPWLGRLGLQFHHDQPPATDSQGRPLPDKRVYSWILRDDTSVRIGITNPNSCWALAGLHTGDILVSIKDRPISTRQDFQTAIGELSVGDDIKVVVKKGTETTTQTVRISGYTTPVIIITEDPSPSPKQRRLLEQWLAGQ